MTRDSPPSAHAFIGLGSNLGDRLAAIDTALAAIREGALGHTRVVRASSVFETRPLGPSTTPFLNAAAELETELEPQALLEGLLALEAAAGRTRDGSWGAARTLDLDVLLYIEAGASASIQLSTEHLTIPHPGLHERDFVLAPLAELVPDMIITADQTAAELLERLPADARTIIRTV